MPLQEESRIWKVLLPVLTGVFFIGAFVVLLPRVTPHTTEKYSEGAKKQVMPRFPVVAVTRSTPEDTRPKFIVAHAGWLKSETAGIPEFSFLLPLGKNAIVDQDGDPASFDVEQIAPGRQRVRLKAVVGDYTYEVEYEAEARTVFPRSLDIEHLAAGTMLAFLYSFIVTLAAYVVAKRLIRRKPQSDAKDSATRQG